jgi:rhodanese-related sulfurtransferase
MRIRVFSLGVVLFATSVAGFAQQPAQTMNAAFDVNVARRVTAEEVKTQLDAGAKVYVIDNRSSFTGQMAKGATHVPIAKIAEWAKEIPKDAMIVAYCTCGAEETSTVAVEKLQKLGFTNAWALKGGLNAWQTVGLPTEAKPAQ